MSFLLKKLPSPLGSFLGKLASILLPINLDNFCQELCDTFEAKTSLSIFKYFAYLDLIHNSKDEDLNKIYKVKLLI